MNWYKRIILARSFSSREVLRKLENYGVYVIREGKGSAKILLNTHNGQTASIHIHKGVDQLEGTVRKILNDLGIDYRFFLRNKPMVYEIEEEEETVEPKIPDWQNTRWFQEQQIQLSSDFSLTKKAKKWKDHIPGGRADKKTPSDFNHKSIEKGKDIEFEHTNDPDIAREITMDHLEEFPEYYSDKNGLPEMERKLKDTKDSRGLYNQQQGDEHNPNAVGEMIQDWEETNKDELRNMRALAKNHKFEAMREYGEQLIQQGFDRLLVEKIQTAAMYKVKL